MYVVGLGGGIGSGKTTVGKLFEAKGISVIDADDLAREVVAIGSYGLAQISEHFGSDILQADGSLNRAKLRAIVFNKPEEKIWLEALTHPLIRQATLAAIENAQSPYAIYISPLLIETDRPDWIKRILIIDCPESTQVERTMARDNNSQSLVESIMANQATRQQRLAAADDVIENTGDEHTLRSQVDTLHHQYLEAAKQ